MKFQVFNQTDGTIIATNCPTLERAVEQAKFFRKTNSTARIEIWSGKPEFAIYNERGQKIGNQR